MLVQKWTKNNHKHKISLFLSQTCFMEPTTIDMDELKFIEQYNREIEEAEVEIARGECFSHEEVIEISKGWLKGR